MLWTFVVLSLGLLVVLFLGRRRSERAVVEDWQLLLTPKGQQVVNAIEGQVDTELSLMSVALDHAALDRRNGDLQEAIRLVELGYRVIERFSPNMLRLLATMAVFSRMVGAMLPMEPLRPRDYRLRQMGAIAFLHQITHKFVLSAGERFRLRLYLIGHGFGVTSRYLVRSAHRIIHQQPDSDREWASVAAIQEDLRTLSGESLKSFRVLVTCLIAEEKANALQHTRS